MRRSIIAALVLTAMADMPTPSPTPPPVIYHGEVRPICAALSQHVKPVIGMMIQNDRTIALSPPLFKRYNQDLANVDPHDRSSNSAARTLTLYHMEKLVGPLAKNVLAMQRELEDPNIFPPKPQSDDDKQLDQLRDALLKALAVQAVTLDLINGFVTTQQLAEMQHDVGPTSTEINAIEGSQLGPGSTPVPPTPNPLLVDPNQAGVGANPYMFDPLAVPGITGSVGNTPITRLLSAVIWTQQEAQRREDAAAQTVMQVVHECGP